MASLTFKKMDAPADRSFSCGNSTIDGQIKDAYLLTCMNRCYAYEVKFCELVVGYYQIQFKRFPLEKFGAPLTDYEIGAYDDLYSLHIEYIAVGKKFQGNKIGSAILKYILMTVNRIHEECPVRLVTLGAVDHKADWYERYGFVKVGTPSIDSCEQLMKIDLISEDEQKYLEAYSDENC